MFVTNKRTSIHRVLKKGDDKNSNQLLKNMLINYEKLDSDTYWTIKWLESDLERLSIYLLEYEEMPKQTEAESPFPEYYKSEFGQIVATLYKNDLFDENLYKFYCD